MALDEFVFLIPSPRSLRMNVTSKLQMFLIVKVFSLYSSRRTPPKSKSPDSGLMLISGLTPFPFSKQLTILLDVYSVSRC